MLKAEIKNRTIGCEFECFCPRLGASSGIDVQRTLAGILTANDIRSFHRGYSPSPIPAGIDCCVEYDSSIRADYQYQGVEYAQLEIKTRILHGYEDFQLVVPKLLAIARELGAKVNSTCGFHLNLGFPEAQKPRHVVSLYNLFYRFEPTIYAILAPSRTNNPYCMTISEGKGYLHDCRTVRDCQQRLGNRNRKHGLNLIHLFDSSPRIEFRYHAGTLNEEKVRHWLVFCLQMVEHSLNRSIRSMEQLPKSRVSLERMITACGFKKNNNVYAEVTPLIRETGKWLLKRYTEFQGRSSLRKERLAEKAKWEFPPANLA